MSWFNENRPELLGEHQPARPAGRRRPRTCCRCSPTRSCGGCWRACSTRASSSATTASARCRAYHQDNPYIFDAGGERVPGRLPAGRVGQRDVRRQLELARARSGRRSTRSSSARCCRLYGYYGDEFKVECPTGSGQHMNLYQVAQELANRLAAIFLLDHEGRRPVYGGMQEVPATIRAGATTCCSTSTSTATTAPAWAPATRQAGRGHPGAHAPVRDADGRR